MEKFNFSSSALNQLDAIKRSLNVDNISIKSNDENAGYPTMCTTCWGGSCATNPITG